MNIKELAEKAAEMNGKTVACKLGTALLRAIEGFEKIQACLGPDHTCRCEGLDAEAEAALEVANDFLKEIESE
jgi:hypothetical protein